MDEVRGHVDVLGQATWDDGTEELPLGAELLAAGHAEVARPAHLDRLDRHAQAYGETGDVASQRGDFAGDLMAWTQAGWRRELAAIEVQVAAADAAVAHADEHAIGRDVRDGYVLHFGLLRSGDDGGLHRCHVHLLRGLRCMSYDGR